MSDSKTIVSIKSVSFSYGKEEVLRNLDLEIAEPSINVLLGLNGCGKTTLIKLMIGSLKNKTGSISFGGKKLDKISFAERAELVSYVPQNIKEDQDFEVIDFLLLAYANSLRIYQTPSNEKVEKAREIADKFHVSSFLEKRMDELSGGERQKVYICSAYIQNTPFIVLDEPTSALDLANQALVISLLKELKKEGKTIILSTHNPNLALHLDANVFLMNDGRIVRKGHCKDMIKADVLSDIYGDNLISSKEAEYDEVTIR